MGCEWKKTTLGQACKNIQTGPFGSQLHKADYVTKGIPSIMPVNIGDNRITTDGIARISKEDVERLSRYLVRNGDIVYSRRGDVERRALVRDREDGWLCGTGCLRVRFDSDLVDSEYASFQLGSPDSREWIVRHAIGATMPNLNTKILSALPFLLPPLSKQKRIAHILGSLDDKIELNRQMNATLEGMAQALFKSWFVDFDPVIDNALAAGNPIPEAFAARAETRRKALADGTANRDVAKQFPAAFQFTDEMGWIPEGWKTKKIADFANITHGFAFKGEYFSVDKTKDVLLTPGNFRIGGGFKESKFKYYKGPVDEEYVLHHQDLIVTMTDLSKAGDTLGYPAFIPISNGIRYLHNQRIGRVLLKNTGVGKFFLYQIFRSNAYRDEILGGVTGSTVKHTSPSKIIAFTFPYSGGILEERIENVLKGFEYSISKKNEESVILSNLRNTLLPKLISGEIRIPEAEKITEEALA